VENRVTVFTFYVFRKANYDEFLRKRWNDFQRNLLQNGIKQEMNVNIMDLGTDLGTWLPFSDGWQDRVKLKVGLTGKLLLYASGQTTWTKILRNTSQILN
jgi:hypothetical protein